LVLIRPWWPSKTGGPGEPVATEPMAPDGDYRYWRDAAGVHHVPKRAVEELIWKEEL